MLDKDVTRLSEPYPPTTSLDGSPLLRLASSLGFDLGKSVQLGDEISKDLDIFTYGIGWWKTYSDLDNQTRILLSDYLLTCARAIPDNLIEAKVELVELEHAAEDYRTWINRGMSSDNRSAAKSPRSPHEELSIERVRTHFAGALRAWGSALDCVAGCIIGVTGIPVDLVKADMRIAQKTLGRYSSSNQLLSQLQTNLERAETDAGPTGMAGVAVGYAKHSRASRTPNGSPVGRPTSKRSAGHGSSPTERTRSH
jgi:hypothetical protein